MIHSLRRQHLIVIVALAVGLPVIFAASLLSRRTFPPVARLPEGPSPSGTQTKFSLWNDVKLNVRFETTATERERRLLYISPTEEFAEPDILVYWDPDGARTGELSQRAILLGALKGKELRRLIVPPAVPETTGFLVLYSLGHRRVIGTAPWRIEGGTR